MLTSTEGSLPRGGDARYLDHQPSRHKITGEGSWFSVVVPHTLQPSQSPPRATKRSYDLHSTTCPLVIPGPLARLWAGDAVCSLRRGSSPAGQVHSPDGPAPPSALTTYLDRWTRLQGQTLRQAEWLRGSCWLPRSPP